MAGVQRVLIVGGGVAGMTLGVGLRRNGLEAEIVEINKDWSVLGLGIALLGPTLRALDTVGLLDRCLEEGLGYSSFVVHNPAGQVVRTVELPRLLGPGRPAAVGIMRPAFHNILSQSCRDAGVPVRLGVTVNSISESGDSVEVSFTDGSRETYDAVVAADGAYSKVRSITFGAEARPKFTGQAVWRATVPRPPEIEALHIYYGGPSQPGLNPVSATEMYIFLVENAPENPRRAEEDLPGILRELLDAFGGPLAVAREHVTSPTQIVYRPIDAMILPAPWHKGRVLAIGDAAHVPTPHLASGAGLAVEDAIVLAELLNPDAAVEAAFEAFTKRRFERCRLVVDNSVQLGAWDLNPGTPGADPVGLLDGSMRALAQPI